MNTPIVKPSSPHIGRAKGTPNLRTTEIMERLAALNCDPITGMALIALDESNTAELRARMFAELAQYVAPKRKSVEFSGDVAAAVVHLAIPPNCTPAEASAAYARLMMD